MLQTVTKKDLIQDQEKDWLNKDKNQYKFFFRIKKFLKNFDRIKREIFSK